MSATLTLDTEQDPRALIATRIFQAPRALVWSLWTDPRHLARWWGPHGYTNPVCEVDLRPGGAIRIDMRSPEGIVHPMWDTLKEGGSVERCGWLRDRWGLSWQITPRRLGELMRDPDTAEAKRVAEAMLKMVKFDIAGLEAAADGACPS